MDHLESEFLLVTRMISKMWYEATNIRRREIFGDNDANSRLGEWLALLRHSVDFNSTGLYFFAKSAISKIPWTDNIQEKLVTIMMISAEHENLDIFADCIHSLSPSKLHAFSTHYYGITCLGHMIPNPQVGSQTGEMALSMSIPSVRLFLEMLDRQDRSAAAFDLIYHALIDIDGRLLEELINLLIPIGAKTVFSIATFIVDKLPTLHFHGRLSEIYSLTCKTLRAPKRRDFDLSILSCYTSLPPKSHIGWLILNVPKLQVRMIEKWPSHARRIEALLSSPASASSLKRKRGTKK